MAGLVEDITSDLTGFASKAKHWEYCSLTNESAQGGVHWTCPTSTNHTTHDKIAIAVYNPSLSTRRLISIPVPDALYNVDIYQPLGGNSMIRDDIHRAQNAAVLCDYWNPHNTSNCVLYINYTIPAQHFGFVFLTRNLSQQGLFVNYQMRGDAKIDTDHQYLEFKSFSEEHGAMFVVQKKSYMTTFHLAFDLRYYPAYQGFEGTRSGASVFRPATNSSLRYSNITNIFIQRSDLVSQITLLYSN